MPQQSVPHNYNSGSVFLSFQSMEDARRLLAHRHVSINNHTYRIAVPMKYFDQCHPNYISPSEAAERMRSAPRYIPGPSLYPQAKLYADPASIEQRSTTIPSFFTGDTRNVSVHILGQEYMEDTIHKRFTYGSPKPDACLEGTPAGPSMIIPVPHSRPSADTEQRLHKGNTNKKANKKRRNKSSYGDHNVSRLPIVDVTREQHFTTEPKGAPAIQVSHEDSFNTELRSSSPGTLYASTPLKQSDSDIDLSNNTTSNADLSVNSEAPSSTDNTAAQASTRKSLAYSENICPNHQLSVGAGGNGGISDSQSNSSIEIHSAEEQGSGAVAEVECFTSRHNAAACAQITPKRLSSVSHERQNSSPRLTEDMDESFQTAAETPESVTDLPARISVSSDHPTMPDAEPPRKLLVSIETKFDDKSNLTRDDSSSRPAPEGTSVLRTTMPATSKSSVVTKTGPSQTESLSPFSRTSQQKKLDRKTKPTRKSKLKIETKQEIGNGNTQVKLSHQPRNSPSQNAETLSEQRLTKPASDLVSEPVSIPTPASEFVLGFRSELASSKRSFFTSPLAAFGVLSGKMSAKVKDGTENAHVIPHVTDQAEFTDPYSPLESQELSVSSFTGQEQSSGSEGRTNDESIMEIAEPHPSPVLHMQSAADESPKSQKKPKKKKKKSKGVDKTVPKAEEQLKTQRITLYKKVNEDFSLQDDESSSSVGTVTANTPSPSRSASADHTQSTIADPNISRVVKKGVRKVGKKRIASVLTTQNTTNESPQITTELLAHEGLQKRLQDPISGDAHLAINPGVQHSMFKMAEIGHQERMVRLRAKGDISGLQKEEHDWQSYVGNSQQFKTSRIESVNEETASASSLRVPGLTPTLSLHLQDGSSRLETSWIAR
ncbi:hypothetical protein MBLNU459_g5656t3 [Dothideomycetes sp. NU459]